MEQLGELHNKAVQLMIKIYNDLLRNEGRVQGERQARLIKVLEAFLEFKSEKEIEKWLLKPNKRCDKLTPLDLIGSEYATRHLLRVINFLQRNGKFAADTQMSKINFKNCHRGKHKSVKIYSNGNAIFGASETVKWCRVCGSVWLWRIGIFNTKEKRFNLRKHCLLFRKPLAFKKR